jgi:hypothetical protein
MTSLKTTDYHILKCEAIPDPFGYVTGPSKNKKAFVDEQRLKAFPRLVENISVINLIIK